MNQKQRKRAANKRGTYSERLASGKIFPRDLEKAHMDGFSKGFAAGQGVIKECYASMCLVLNKQYGFGAKRLLTVLQDIDKDLLLFYDNEEKTNEVLERFGIEIDLNMPEDDPDTIFEPRVKGENK